MINFRYHVVTLVAVFLALGLGVLFGASFIDQNTVEILERSQKRLGDRNKQLRDQVLALERDVKDSSAFIDGAKTTLIRASLKDRPSLILSFDSNDEVLESAGQTLVLAGSKVEGSLRFSENIDLSNATRRQQVALAIGSDLTETEPLRAAFIQEISVALAGKKPGVLQRISDSGLIEQLQVAGGQPRSLATLASPQSLLVIVAPSADKKALAESFVLPLVRALAIQDVLVAVVANAEEGSQLIAGVRSDGNIKAITVDNIHVSEGQAALALGLQAAISGRFGHYGSAEGATSLLPESVPAN